MATGEQTTRDAANEVVRAAVEWKRACLAHMASYEDHTIQNEDRAELNMRASDAGKAVWKAVDAYLANNLPDSAQHPTPNPG